MLKVSFRSKFILVFPFSVEQMWNIKPNKRPSFLDIHVFLRNYKNELSSKNQEIPFSSQDELTKQWFPYMTINPSDTLKSRDKTINHSYKNWSLPRSSSSSRMVSLQLSLSTVNTSGYTL